jgi:ABC-type cobalamin/Fe3+-siderophores transport system ATPase subunit
MNPEGGRIFAVMGPNGAGKSRLLEQLEAQAKSKGLIAIRITATRALSTSPVESVKPSDAGVNVMAHLVESRLPLAEAPWWVVKSIQESAPSAEQRYKDTLWAWHRGGKKITEPTIPQDEMKTFRALLNELLGYRVKIGEEVYPPLPRKPVVPRSLASRQVDARSGDRKKQPKIHFLMEGTKDSFGVESLSDGEKQILMSGSVLMDKPDHDFVFLVDEPELYLNEAKAIEFWEKIEGHFSRSVFLYATHNVVFATRPNISRTYLMGMGGKLEILPQDEPLSHSVVRSLVGARVQILRTSKPIIFCEDTNLRHVATDLVGAGDFDFVLLEGHQTVVSAVSKEIKRGTKSGRPILIVESLTGMPETMLMWTRSRARAFSAFRCSRQSHS